MLSLLSQNISYTQVFFYIFFIIKVKIMKILIRKKIFINKYE